MSDRSSTRRERSGGVSGILSRIRDGARITFQVDGRVQRATDGWYRGESCDFNPNVNNLEAPDAVIRHVVGAWAPATPLIGPETRVCAFGSCFAAHISSWLAERNFSVLTRKGGEAENTYVVRFGEGLVNSY